MSEFSRLGRVRLPNSNEEALAPRQMANGGSLNKKSPRSLKGLNLERVRRVELPTLCLASEKGPGAMKNHLQNQPAYSLPFPNSPLKSEKFFTLRGCHETSLAFA